MSGKEKFNLLEEWRSDLHSLTSDFNPNRLQFFGKAEIEFIFDVFNSFFDSSYFILEKNKYIKKQDIIFEDNYFLNLISQKNIPSLFALLDIANLIIFSKRLPEDIYSRLLSLRGSPERLRDYLFEIYSYRFFYKNGITIVPKPIFNNREIEGLFRWDSTTSILECKKLYNHEAERFNFLKWGYRNLIRKWLKVQPEIMAFIYAPSEDVSQINKDKVLVEKGLLEYFGKVKRNFDVVYPFEVFNDIGQKILQIELKNYPIFKHLHYVIPRPYCYFIVHQPPVVYPKGVNHMRVVFGYCLSLEKSKMFERLDVQIRRKRKQQKDSGPVNRFFFFENEIVSKADLPLLFESQLEELDLRNSLNSKDSNDIVCIVFKKSNLDGPPEIKIKAYAKDSLAEIVAKIESLPTFDYQH